MTMGADTASDVLRRNPITGIIGCCARAATGQAAAPPTSLMNSPRLIAAPDVRSGHRSGFNRDTGSGLRMSAMGQKQTSAHVCVMSALPPKADIDGSIGMSVRRD